MNFSCFWSGLSKNILTVNLKILRLQKPCYLSSDYLWNHYLQDSIDAPWDIFHTIVLSLNKLSDLIFTRTVIINTSVQHNLPHMFSLFQLLRLLEHIKVKDHIVEYYLKENVAVVTIYMSQYLWGYGSFKIIFPTWRGKPSLKWTPIKRTILIL